VSITVSILEHHIQRGLRGAQKSDAFAMALSEAIVKQMGRPKGSFNISVPNRDALFIEGYLACWLPDIAQEFIRKSDCQETLVPTHFELDIPNGLFDPRKHQKL
jgi:hypothetical protein